MKKSQSLLWLTLAILFAVASTILLLSYMVTDPANSIIDLGGDCGKNYFTYMYHSIYDHGTWFQGMNYPYGENIIYADGQPILSTFLNLFTHVNVHQALAIMNLCMGVSFAIAIIFTYKILVRFGVYPFIAILFACLINLISPQVLRFRAHFALSYLCFIPVLFYCSILYHATQKWKWAVYIFILGFIFSFLHLYFGAIIFLWLLSYIAGCLLLTKGTFRLRFKHTLPMILVFIALFISIKGGVAITDPVKDRPAYPWGSLEYVTHVKDLITSTYSPVWEFIKDKSGFSRIADNREEGYSYLGIVSIGILLWAALLWLIRKIRNRESGNPVSVENNFSPVWLFIALCALLMAMGVPFIWHLAWLMDYLSIFKQFRSLGRFSWIFFYIASIYSVVVLYRWYAAHMINGKRIIAYVLLLSCMAVWSFEVSGYIKYTRGYLAKSKSVCNDFFYADEINWEEYLAKNNLKNNDFQGIILLPFFACGSEKLWVGDDIGWQFTVGIRASVELHLPIVDIMMSRTSWSVTEKQVKTVAGPYADKPMLRDIKSNKPFLLIRFGISPINRDEAYLFQASDYIGNHFLSDLYICYPDRIIANDKKYRDGLLAVVPYMHTADTCVENKGEWYINHYDENTGIPHFFGTGEHAPIKETSKIITTISIKPLRDSQMYELSCWFLVPDKDFRSPGITIHMLDSAGNNIMSIDALAKKSVDNDKMWFRTAAYFAMPGKCRELALEILNDPNPAYISMDELLIRPVDANIISKGADGRIMLNNHILYTDKPTKQ